jgi:pimeloyl-ACP methyl ester carboxylesterase
MSHEPVIHRVDLTTGLRTAYVEQGDRSGPTVVMLHAWVESLRCFDRLTAMLPDWLHVLAVDQRGHGQADAPEDGYDVGTLATDVVAFMDACGLPRAVLVGASSGGYVAQQLAVRNPERVTGLVLLGSPLSLHGRPEFADTVDAVRDPIDPVWVKAFIEEFPLFHEVPTWYLEDRILEATRVPARVWQSALRGLTTSPPPLETGRISAPTLIIRGARDEVLTPESQAAMADRIPGSTLLTYGGVGHLVLWEQPERIAADLVEFVGRL